MVMLTEQRRKCRGSAYKREKCNSGRGYNRSNEDSCTCPDATLIYILPPSWDELKSRLSSTGIYTEEEVNALMEIAEEEISCANSYDYILVNDTISNTLSRFAQIIHSNRYSRNCMKEFLDSYIDGEVKPHVQSYKEALL